MPPSTALQWALLALPISVIIAYFLTAFPSSPDTLYVHPSLATLPKSSPSWKIYPEDFYKGGAYVRLPYGTVRYWLIGPKDGQRVVLIHGLSVPAIIWKDIAPRLAESGYRVLMYDLYGRGYSDAPQTTYDNDLYTIQLALLMQHVHWDNAHIVGVSMGGGIAVAFSAQFPQLTTDRLVLIAPSGLLDPADMSRTSRFLSSPVMQLLTSSYPFRLYLQYLANNRQSSNPVGELIRIQSAHLPGYNLAIASSIRDGPIRSQAPAYVAVGRRSRKEGGKVLLIWGTDDTTVPYHCAARVTAFIPHADLLTIDGGKHNILDTHADQVGEALVNFLG